MGSPRADDGAARAWGGLLVPSVLAGLAAMYFVGVWAESMKAGTAARHLPAPIAYFMQVAALFPGAARHAIDYRVEGYRCRDKTWAEIDVTRWFPIDAGNKENHFYRVMHFYGDA